MPKFRTYFGLAQTRLVAQFGDELHIDGRVYRVSDLSEVIGKKAMPALHGADTSTIKSWNVRLKRGYHPNNRKSTGNNSPHFLMSDFDVALCGVWDGATIASVDRGNSVVRAGAAHDNSYLGMAVEYDYNKGTVLDIGVSKFSYGPNLVSDQFVALKASAGGNLLLTRNHANSTIVGSVDSLPSTAALDAASTLLFGSKTTSLNGQLAHRFAEDEQNVYLLTTWSGNTSNTSVNIYKNSKTTLAHSALWGGVVGAPSGTTAVGSGPGYANSGLSYAIKTDVNELSSYIAFRHTSGIEIHRLELAGINSGSPVASMSLLTMDANPMLIHGSASAGTGIRCVVATLPNGEKYLLVLSMEPLITPVASTSKLYCYKIVNKNTLQYVSTTNLAASPRHYLATDDNWTRFVTVYDDRYEMYSMGVGGSVTLTETAMVPRAVSGQYYSSDAYGFDSVGRFWYLYPESTKPDVLLQLGINYIAPPGAINTVELATDRDVYEFVSTTTPGVLSVAVRDVNGDYLATTVKLSSSPNVVISSDTILTSGSGPVSIGFVVTAPGEVNITAATL